MSKEDPTRRPTSSNARGRRQRSSAKRKSRSTRLRVVLRTKIPDQIERIVIAKQTIWIAQSNDLSLLPRILERFTKALQTCSRLSLHNWNEKKVS